MALPSQSYMHTSRIDAPAERVYQWHTEPGALERLTPPWERVVVVDPGSGMREGSRVVLRVGQAPFAARWIAEYGEIVPGRSFTDTQIEGPFAHWVHRHSMEPTGEEASSLTDRVEYALPHHPLTDPIVGRGVRRRLERLFTYRHSIIRDDLVAHERFRDRRPMHVVVSGASGLIGSALLPFLTTGGHRVTRLVRRTPGQDEIYWNPTSGRLDPRSLVGADAVVHLAGENIAGHRWTPDHKRRVLESRQSGTRLIAEALAKLAGPSPVLLAASAIGYYGNRGDDPLSEDSAVGSGFLADVAQAWETATRPAEDAGVRVVRLRIGVVLTPAGGALRRMLPLFRLGLGGRVGSGAQWMSWISIDDVVGAIHHALFTESLRGAVNGTAPNAVRNTTFTNSLGDAVNRPTIALVPASALRLAFGEMADELLLAGARVVPEKLLASGYRFRHPDLASALAHVLGSSKQ